MYLSHFGLDEAPFRITPHTEFFFAGANRGATLEALIYAISHDEGIVKVTGEVGSGKTMLCRVLIERMPESVKLIYLGNPSLSRDEILHVLAADFGVEAHSDRTTIVLRALQEKLIELYARDQRVVVLIDEAHAMPLETLEEIRLLSNLESNRQKLLQIVLFGQPELNEHLSLPHMRQLKERITHSFNLEALVRPDIEQYIDFRMRAAGYRGPSVFTPRALRLIARASEGLTRRINILADKSLLAAFAAGSHAVEAHHARAAVRDSDYHPRAPHWRPWALGAAVLAIGIAIGVALRSAGPILDRIEPTATASPIAASAPAAASEQTIEKQGATAAAAVDPSHEAPQVASAGAIPPVGGPLAAARFAATQQWLAGAPANQFSIQLMTTARVQSLEQALQSFSAAVPLQDLHVYGFKTEGGQRYAIAYGLYPNSAATIEAIDQLPAALRTQHPYQRNIGTMQRQNRQ